MGKNNIDDLDSIYFFDKINMRSNSASITKVPKLDFNIMKLKLKKYEEQQQQVITNQSQINYQNNSINNNNVNNTNNNISNNQAQINYHQIQNTKKVKFNKF